MASLCALSHYAFINMITVSRLRKELFAFTENKIAVQFWYEFYDEQDKNWYRCYGLGVSGF